MTDLRIAFLRKLLDGEYRLSWFQRPCALNHPESFIMSLEHQRGCTWVQSCLCPCGPNRELDSDETLEWVTECIMAHKRQLGHVKKTREARDQEFLNAVNA